MSQANGFDSAKIWTQIGAALFLVALLGSAIVAPELRLLHSFQALIYIAVIILARWNSPWGYGAGFAVAVVWNAMSLFVTHLIQTGALALLALLRTGHSEQIVPMMVTLGGAAHFIIIIASLIALLRNDKGKGKWFKFAGGGVLSMTYFALLVVLFHPR